MDKRLDKYISDHSSKEDPLLEELFRQTHIRFVNPNMVSGHMQGILLEFISRMISPQMILEIGTFTGYSAICLAKGLRPGGKLITIEVNDEMADFSNSYFGRSGMSDNIIPMTGRAQDIVPKLGYTFDLVYIDGDKREYYDYFIALKDKVRPGGFIIADNVLWGDKVIGEDTKDAQTRGILKFNEMLSMDGNFEKVILPVRDGIMLIRKIF